MLTDLLRRIAEETKPPQARYAIGRVSVSYTPDPLPQPITTSVYDTDRASEPAVFFEYIRPPVLPSPEELDALLADIEAERERGNTCTVYDFACRAIADRYGFDFEDVYRALLDVEDARRQETGEEWLADLLAKPLGWTSAAAAVRYTIEGVPGGEADALVPTIH
jgi:hypothetical protein